MPTRAKRVFQVPPTRKYCWAATAHVPPGTCGSTATDEKSPNRVWLVVLPRIRTVPVPMRLVIGWPADNVSTTTEVAVPAGASVKAQLR